MANVQITGEHGSPVVLGEVPKPQSDGVEEAVLLVLLRGVCLTRVDVGGDHGDGALRAMDVDLEPPASIGELRWTQVATHT